MFLWLKTLYRKRAVTWPFIFYTIIWTLSTEFSLSVGKNYKYINKYIDEDLWNRLLSTYRMDSYENIWKSLFICHQLFREVSKEVAELLGFDYPEYGKNITRYTEDMYKKYVENDYF